MPKRPITPLWIIALFVSLSETVLGIAVTQTTGEIQVALTAFVIGFPLLIAVGFFVILWNRPYVFYPPTEFGSSTDVGSFVQAMNRPSIDTHSLYGSIQDTLRSTISTKGLLAEIAEVVSPKVVRKAERQINSKVNLLVGQAVDRIREANFLTIDTRPIAGPAGEIWQLPYERFATVASFLDDIWYALSKRMRLKAFTYGSAWVLRDPKTKKTFEKMGTKWAGGEKDLRTLEEAGIKAGFSLEIIRP